MKSEESVITRYSFYSLYMIVLMSEFNCLSVNVAPRDVMIKCAAELSPIEKARAHDVQALFNLISVGEILKRC